MNSKNITVVPPAYESLFGVHRNDSIWPELILNNSAIQIEIRTRRHLNDCLKKIFSILPRADMEITTAIDTGLITLMQAEELYVELVEFFETSEHNKRILLYLPFELIPDADWKIESKSLTRAIVEFHEIYLSAWEELLSHYDIRACFTDGDILEPGLRKEPLPRVVKAAHLAWVLVSKGLISSKRVIELITASRDEVLRQSLGEAVRVIYDLDLVDLDSMIDSGDPLLQKIVVELKGRIKTLDKTNQLNLPCRLKELIPNINDELGNLEEEFDNLEEHVSAGRIKWLRQKGSQNIAKNFAGRISSALDEGLISIDEFKEFVKEHAHDELWVQVSVEAIGKFLEIMVSKDLATARSLYKILNPLITAGNQNSQAISYALKGVRLRLSFLGVIDREMSAQPGESFVLEEAVNSTELDQLASIVKMIEMNDQLSKILYPVLLLYGSRAKGYGSADFDLAVMIRPWAGLNLRDTVKEALVGIARKVGVEASFMEFWLKWESGLLGIRDFEDPDMDIGGNDFAHILFESAWIGQHQDVRPIFSGLISRFLLPDSGGIIQAVRPLLLKEMERNTLQFRLMHRGYAHMYPCQGGIKTRNSSGIDSESSFWDSGYRQLATKLFVTRVFLTAQKEGE